MKKPRVLLTGDDGYSSLGTRILVSVLRDAFDLSIAGTATQQSGVGGRISMKTGGKWSEAVVDGIPALVVEGTPVDAMEVSQGYFEKPFDFIVSGINWGANVGNCITSGTFAAADSGLRLRVAPKAIAMSWHLPPEYWLNEPGTGKIDAYVVYPGKAARKLVDLAVASGFWGAQLLNINFPALPSSDVRFVQPMPDMTKFYRYPVKLDREKGTFAYTMEFAEKQETDMAFDGPNMLAGRISLTPCKADMMDEKLFETLADRTIDLGEK